jgi:ABC-type antimicrobial peptide transport system permease subunit
MSIKIQSTLVVSVLILGVIICGVPSFVLGTGALGNEPSTGYSEGNEVFAITKDDFAKTATTAFDIGETFRVHITSQLVDLLGNGQRENRVIIADYLGNPVGLTPTFAQQDDGSDHKYTAILTAPNTPDHYLVAAKIEDNNHNIFEAMDVIIVGGGASPQKYIKTYSDPGYSNLDWTFTSEDTIYIEVYSDILVDPNPGQSSVTFADYSGGGSSKKVGQLSNPEITRSGDYTRIQYDLSIDLEVLELTDGILNAGYWYGLTVFLGTGTTTITADWTIQIQITAVIVPTLSLQAGTTEASPQIVQREGNYQTTIRAEFEDTDAPSADSFIVTLKVRDDNGDEITIVDRKTHGGAGAFGGTVSVTSSGTGLYTVSYDLNPDDNFISGNYDLYFKVEDGTGEEVEDAFQNNNNELLITSPTLAPNVNWDSTECDPDLVDKIGEYVTKISADFSDSDSLNVTDFSVLFKIRDEDGNEIILVNNKTHGETGELGGTLTITSSVQGVYSASYTFDPEGGFQVGDYDLYFKVTDQHGNSDTDEYIPNSNELHIISSAYEPTVNTGATFFDPTEVDKTGDKVTKIQTQFEDIDTDQLSDFTVTFKVKDEEGNEYVLVDAAKSGEAGEYGGTLSITSSSPNVYVASYIWDPPSTMPNGNYSLYFMVEDEHGSFAEDMYADNANELTISGKEEEPAEEPSTDILLLLIIIIIIVMLILFLAALKGRKRKEKPYMPPTETAEESPTSPPVLTPEEELPPPAE